MKFSLIMGTLGRVEEVGAFLASLQRQDHRDFELLIVDQNPDERLAPLVEQYRHAVEHTMFELPAGHVDPGETEEAAMKRELLEETGLSVGTLTDWRLTNRYEIWPQWRARYAPDVTHNVEHVFGFRVPQITVATLDPAEHTAQLWLPWQQAMEKVFSPTNRDAIGQLSHRR